MVDIGISPGTTETARLVVDEVTGTLAIVGAGAAGGPSRKVDVFEDMRVRGNLRVGEVHAVRARWEQGVDGAIHAGADDEVPRVEKLAGDPNLHIIGGGPLGGPNRNVVVHDNLDVSNDIDAGHDVTASNDITAGGAVSGTSVTAGTVTADYVTGADGVSAGDMAGWTTLYGRNMVYAAGTFHLYDLGAGLLYKQCCGFGFDPSTPVGFGVNMNHPPLAGFPPVVMLMLDNPIERCVVSVNAWLVAQYDETSPPGVLPILTAWSGPPPQIHPYITIKGIANPTGAMPMGPLAHQIEIYFATDDTMLPFIPASGSPRADLVFDVVVMGSPAIIL